MDHMETPSQLPGDEGAVDHSELDAANSASARSINQDQIRAHVERLHVLAAPYKHKGVLGLSGFGTRPDGTILEPLNGHFGIGDAEAMVAAIANVGTEPYGNIYTSLAILRPDLPQGRKGGEKDVVAVLGLVADFDDPDAAAYNDRLPLPPDMVLETSAGRYQASYLFNYPLLPDEAKLIAEALQAYSGCDPCSQDISHVWRIPGTLNWPNPKKLAEGRPPEPQVVKLVVDPGEGDDFNRTDPSALRAALEQAGSIAQLGITSALQGDKAPPIDQILTASILAQLGLAPTEKGGAVNGRDELVVRLRSTKSTVFIANLLDQAPIIGKRSATIYNLAGLIAREGYSLADAVKLIGGSPVGLSKYEGWSQTQISNDIRRCYSRVDDTANALSDDAIQAIVGRELNNESASIEDDVFKMLSINDCIARQSFRTRWLVDGLLPVRGLAVLYGPSNSFKSFIALDLACHIAHGAPYHGRAVTQAPALYIALEGSDGVIKQRVPGWHLHYKWDGRDAPLDVIETQMILTKEADALKLRRTVIKRYGRVPAFIAIDVLKRVMDGSENEDDVVARLVRILREVFLTDEAPCLILVITHTGYADQSHARGHSDLWGSYDTRLKMEGNKESLTAVLTVERHKDAESGGQIRFKMEKVETGMVSDDGQPITTLVPIEVGGAHISADAIMGPKLSPQSQKALTLLQGALGSDGIEVAGHSDIPDGTLAVPFGAWRKICSEEGLLSNPSQDPAKRAEANRKAFDRAKNDLIAKGAVATNTEVSLVWIVQPEIGKTGQAGHVPGQSQDVRRRTNGTDGTHSFRSVPPVPVAVQTPGPESQSDFDFASLDFTNVEPFRVMQSPPFSIM